MTQLKTLKDLEKHWGKRHIDTIVNIESDLDVGYMLECQIKDLRAEAIKWIKSNSPMLNDCDDAVAIWIKFFFNLTEEDLK